MSEQNSGLFGWSCLFRNKNKLPKRDFYKDFDKYADLWKGHKDTYKWPVRASENYIIYINKYDEVAFETTDACDNNQNKDDKTKYDKIISDCLVTSTMPMIGLTAALVLKFNQIIGEALANCFDKNFEGAENILSRAAQFRTDRIIEKSRNWYLRGALILTIFVIIVSIVVNNCQGHICPEWLQRFNCGVWGVFGACLSIIIRTGKSQYVSQSGWGLHFIEAASRLIVGGAAGLMTYFGIKAGILFSGLARPETEPYVVLLLTTLMGASEKFVPSLITKFENVSSDRQRRGGKAPQIGSGTANP